MIQLETQTKLLTRAGAYNQAIAWMYADDIITTRFVNELLEALKKADEFLKYESKISITNTQTNLFTLLNDAIEKRNKSLFAVIEFADELLNQVFTLGNASENKEDIRQLQQDMQLLTKSITLMTTNITDALPISEYQSTYDAVQANIKKSDDDCKTKQKAAGKHSKWEKVAIGVGYTIAAVSFAGFIAACTLLTAGGALFTLLMLGLSCTMAGGTVLGTIPLFAPSDRKTNIKQAKLANPVYKANTATLFHANRLYELKKQDLGLIKSVRPR